MWDLNDLALRQAITRHTANVYIALEQSKVFLTKERSAHDRIAHFHGVSGSFFQLFRRDTTCSARPLQYLTPSKQQSYSKRPWCRAHAHTHQYRPIGRVGSDCGFDICWYFRMLPASSSIFFASISPSWSFCRRNATSQCNGPWTRIHLATLWRWSYIYFDSPSLLLQPNTWSQTKHTSFGVIRKACVSWN